jgi:hypothetical protein
MRIDRRFPRLELQFRRFERRDDAACGVMGFENDFPLGRGEHPHGRRDDCGRHFRKISSVRFHITAVFSRASYPSQTRSES